MSVHWQATDKVLFAAGIWGIVQFLLGVQSILAFRKLCTGRFRIVVHELTVVRGVAKPFCPWIAVVVIELLRLQAPPAPLL